MPFFRQNTLFIYLFHQFQDFDDSLLDSLVSIQPFNSAKDFRYDEYRDDPNEFRYEDDDDSNDEFNERNDYPDEDDEDDERYYGGFDDEDDYQMGVGMKGKFVK